MYFCANVPCHSADVMTCNCVPVFLLVGLWIESVSLLFLCFTASFQMFTGGTPLSYEILKVPAPNYTDLSCSHRDSSFLYSSVFACCLSLVRVRFWNGVIEFFWCILSLDVLIIDQKNCRRWTQCQKYVKEVCINWTLFLFSEQLMYIHTCFAKNSKYPTIQKLEKIPLSGWVMYVITFQDWAVKVHLYGSRYISVLTSNTDLTFFLIFLLLFHLLIH